MIRIRIVSASLVVASLLASCGGGGGGSTAPPIVQPSDLSYGASTALYLVQVAIPSSTPQFQGSVSSFSISPALPAGLVIDASSGSVSGTPQAVSDLTSYTVTASGPSGSTTFDLRIGVVQPPRFAYAAGTDDGTLSTYTIDAATGEMRFRSFQPITGGATAPEALHVHSNGLFAYVPFLEDGVAPGSVANFTIDPASGSLTLRGSASAGVGPHAVSLESSGQFAYVTAFGDDAVRAFAIDQTTGDLTRIGLTTATGDGPIAVAADPEGRFLYVVNETSNDISVFSIGTNGALTAMSTKALSGSGSSALAIDPSGDMLRLVQTGSETVRSFSIDEATGALTPLGVAQPTGAQPASIAVHPTGRFAYTTDAGSGTVTRFRINATTGLLSQTGIQGVSDVGGSPEFLTFDAAGLYAFVLKPATDEISILRVNLENGRLIPLTGQRMRGMPQSLTMTLGASPTVLQAKFVHVLNQASDDISGFAVDPATGLLSSIFTGMAVGQGPTELASDPLGRFLYVTNTGATANGIRKYSMDIDTGALTEVSAPTALASEPTGIVVDPSGRHLYAVVRGTVEKLLSFAIDAATGELTPVAEEVTDVEPRAVAIDPTGRFLYVSHTDSSDPEEPKILCAYRIEDGQFLFGPMVTPAPGRPREIRFAPQGDRAFVALTDAASLASYTINSVTGALAPVPPGTPTGENPQVIEVHASGTLAYAAVADFAGTGFVDVLSIHPLTARLTSLGHVEAGQNPVNLRLDPAGRHLYVINRNSNNLSIYSVDGSTGTLSAIGTVDTGLAPRSIAITSVVE